MPARHDILCGALDFLWKPWGSIELWERPITYSLRRKGIPTQLITDHPHLFEVGGENYHTDFFAWDYVRGHESDPGRRDRILAGRVLHRLLPKPSTRMRRIQTGLATTSRVLTSEKKPTIRDPKPCAPLRIGSNPRIRTFFFPFVR